MFADDELLADIRNRAGPPAKDTPNQKKGSNAASSGTKPKIAQASQSKPSSPNVNGAVNIVKKPRRSSDGRSVDLGKSQASSVSSTPGRNGFQGAGLSMSTK